jgi:hypothetical protein
MTDESFWRRCSTCKQPIAYKRGYFVCSVSTCNRKGTDFVFCKVDCWDAHLPTFRHREAWAEEKTAPSAEEWRRQQEAPPPREAAASVRASAGGGGSGGGVRSSPPSTTREPGMTATERPAPRVHESGPAEPHGDKLDPHHGHVASGGSGLTQSSQIPREILVVVSKLKAYVKARAGMNTSDEVIETLSDRLRTLCDKAIAHAREDGRKTIMSRDFRNIP